MLPSVDRILSSEACQPLVTRYGRTRCTSEIRQVLEAVRSEITQTKVTTVPGLEELVERVDGRLRQSENNSFVSVLNLTGTVLHTNLGRAYLPETALKAIVEVAQGASNLEFDIAQGKRGDRDDHLSALISELT
ncbi:MAG: L-seryl-tRNA(Sec) selenium transferase, partial [Pseudomonadales bacterium]|nr:L-seryl-tRNA(Sec) selenium transferase [Pseudomonadales bacterium]